ncbi:helicase [Endozoicomonas sp. OPT23]|uniref:DISARM system SNF2-like helicase DrmD n=1 Tax=Endozoicomonas sp. OPT23 TaxID=2072845 RepID=UPI00129AE15C|nr:DISARM system SNF2-like helicase DrmD [Endozoicomonas sp. OPT23]MRI31382.1 helicase [Endozoicomonas sp. OPT23]
MTDHMNIYAPPEPGQLVEVRRRQWIVADVNASEMHVSPNQKQHMISLNSIEEDGLGEELEVLWEIEPGAHIIERAGLPTITGIDDAEKLEAFLDAVRWGAATNADRGFLQAPFRSGVSIEDFQLDPLVRAIDMARANLLIADDVGLGKTIEAGLVVQELLLRHRARTVLVVCPASLQEKWRVEMQEKFGLEFKIVDSNYIKGVRRKRGIHANPWTSFPRLITSMHWAKSGEGLRTMKDILPPHAGFPRKFDILIVDEAHNIAPASSTHYAVDSLRTRFIRTIAPHFQHRLFLSATPHNGYTESFTSLLELLDDQRFARTIEPDQEQLSQIMVRRLKTDIVDADGNRIYPTRELHALKIPYSGAERDIHKVLQDYCESRSIAAREQGSVKGTEFIHKLLKKRLFSSPAAFASTLEKHIQSVEGKREQKQRNSLDERILKKRILKAEEDFANDTEYETAQGEAVEEAGRHALPLTPEQKELISEMRSWAQAMRNRVDAKAQSILSWVESHLKTDGEWNNQRVILFTEYRTTHQWLHQILSSNDLGGDRLNVIHGSMDHDEREKVKAAFQANPAVSPVRILLATDAASEGIDLQNHCCYLIHVEIPWNPNVMEQRNGRIDRHGQRHSEVHIWHPVDSHFNEEDVNPAVNVNKLEGQSEYLMRAVRKIDAMRQMLGSVGPVIEQQIEEAMLGKRNDLDTRVAEKKAELSKKLIRSERQLKEKIANLHSRIVETRKEFHLTPDRVAATVKTALTLADKPALQTTTLAGAPDGSIYRMPNLTGSWAKCWEGLRHPHTGEIRPITFDHDVAKGRDDVVLIHLNHRLVQMSLRLLRAEVWAQDDVKKLHRVAIRSLPDTDIESPAVMVVSRLVVTGGNHHRLHEELTLSGGYLRDTRFTRERGVSVIDSWNQTSNPATVPESLLSALNKRFENHRDTIIQTVEARSKDRLNGLSSSLEKLKAREIKNISTILDELQSSIEEELKKDEDPEQFSLFTEDERTQIRRDNAALEARLAKIPEEREQEVAAIEHRFADLKHRTFPVTVILMVPESLIAS